MGYRPPPPPGQPDSAFEHPRLGVMSLYGDYGEQVIGERTRPGAPSMDLYHLMNAGLLFSLIALVAAVLHAVGVL